MAPRAGCVHSVRRLHTTHRVRTFSPRSGERYSWQTDCGKGNREFTPRAPAEPPFARYFSFPPTNRYTTAPTAPPMIGAIQNSHSC